jgi:alginate O-acetyltransferase complex protein AlgI
MRFDSFEFLLFFAIVVPTFFVLPFRGRNTWLLAASVFFYMFWSPVFILLILWSTTIDYFVARRLDRTEATPARRALLSLSYMTNFGALFIFKYFNFFMTTGGALASRLGIGFDPPFLKVILPVGISFYTFEAISYTTDVYRRTYKAEQSYPRLLLFITFFPKLIAGPIERAWHLIPQFERRTRFDGVRVRDGLAQILWGFFKKLVIADRLAIYVNAVYNNASHHVGSSLLLATFCFALQIYCDFSAYSDIAIGTSKILGIDLLRNFRRPYFATSIADFWSRWHISLSTWFRDYVYIPLGGNRLGFSRTQLNIFTVFLVSGIWHGASWTFALWGIYHGVFLLLQNLWNRFVPTIVPPSPAKRWLQVAITFPVVVLSWVLFRANSVGDAWHIYSQIFGNFDAAHVFRAGMRNYAFGAFGVATLFAVEFAMERGGYARLWLPELRPLRWAAYVLIPIVIVTIGVFDGGQFIYFQF